MVIPVAAVIPPMIDFVSAFVVAIVVMLAYGVVPPIQILLVPLLALLALDDRARRRALAQRAERPLPRRPASSCRS